MPTHDLDLHNEQQHLAESRAQLIRMRERTAGMDSSAAGDWVSREYLESTFQLRMRQLADDPTIPLFFGRIDYAPVVSRRSQSDLPSRRAEGPSSGHRLNQRGGGEDSYYIGRRHISDPDGDPMVIDWRAPVSLPFYRATRIEPMGIERRRRFGFQHGALTAFEDEDLSAPEERGYSELLEAEIERPRVGPMRDIVATIQPEQDIIVRADLSESICVQGAPGTGKTAVGLHRAAYLLYTHREQLHRQGVLVVGPNASFLRYIRDVLPALGEIDAKQTTIEELVGKATPIAATEPADVATLKGDARLAIVLARALWSHLVPPAESLVVPRGASRWRVATYEAESIVAELRTRGVRYAAARAMLPQSLAHRLLVKMELSGDSPDDRVQNAVARSAPVKAYANALWPAVEPRRLVWRILSDPDFLAAAADEVLTPDEQARLLWTKPPRSAGAARWTLADAVLIDEATDLVERTGSVAHIVADEAQDLSAMMLRALGRRCSTGSVTVLGDLAQATTPWGSRSWSDALTHLGKPSAHVEQLTRGFRVPGEVIEYAARLLPHVAVDLEPPTSVRRSRGELAFAPRSELRRRLDGVAVLEGSIGLIVPDGLVEPVSAELSDLILAVVGREVGDDETEFDAHLDVVPASLAKGLEYDHVLLVEPAAIVAAEPDRVTGLRRLYVCLTRAVSSLVVLHDEPLPGELAATLEA